MNRKEAAMLGKSKYNTGQPCKNGHFSDRYTLNGICVACASSYQKRAYSDIRRARNEARFGPAAQPLTTPRVAIRQELLGPVESLLQALMRHDPRATNLLALWTTGGAK
jgi:hypothetical protein